MPRGVLRWLACSMCGRSPAAYECGDHPICGHCFNLLGAYMGCGGGRARHRRTDVDVELLESVRRAKPGGGPGGGKLSRRIRKETP
ncbi:hypothetical protein ACAM_1370 [Aeropyrum camini SY1 = JCM 12091]|uniref:Uncharacterized protein n=2 Tax=Aeropyrum camini TaxID=229980 RepID=U3THL9_9CREN|nr:hypothetical protein ACAM_1370 [Aeropyrum camini SY1 = JCM 12091]